MEEWFTIVSNQAVLVIRCSALKVYKANVVWTIFESFVDSNVSKNEKSEIQHSCVGRDILTLFLFS